MTNSNCLSDIRCPRCGSEDEFYISGRVLACVTDDGAEPASCSSISWDDASAIECAACAHSGTVADFTVTEAGEERP